MCGYIVIQTGDLTLKRICKNSKNGFTLVELLVVLVIMAVLAAAIIPSVMGFIDKAKENDAITEAESVKLAATAGLVEWYGTEPKPTDAIDLRHQLQTIMKPLMKSQCGMTREDYDCNGNNTFTTLTSTNNVNWGNITDKSRGTNRAIIYTSADRRRILGIFYIDKDGKYAVRIIMEPWNSLNKAPEVQTAGVFVEKLS